MDNLENEIIVVNSLDNIELPNDYQKHYFTHILCHRGKGRFRLDNKEYTISPNDIVILLPASQIDDWMFSSDFEATYLLISFGLMSNNNPDIGWGIKGYMFIKEYPVVSLSEKNKDRCFDNFLQLKEKYEDTHHRFRKEIVNLQLQIFVMEMWHIFNEKMEKRILSNEKGSIFEKFLQLAQMHCMQQREIEFYSDKLFITAKYLSEICKKTSGKTASEWIQNYTTQHLILLLRNKKLSFTDIADTMNFSSQSFFSRYVRKVLGVTPSQYRLRLKD